MRNSIATIFARFSSVKNSTPTIFARFRGGDFRYYVCTTKRRCKRGLKSARRQPQRQAKVLHLYYKRTASLKGRGGGAKRAHRQPQRHIDFKGEGARRQPQQHIQVLSLYYKKTFLKGRKGGIPMGGTRPGQDTGGAGRGRVGRAATGGSDGWRSAAPNTKTPHIDVGKIS